MNRADRRAEAKRQRRCPHRWTWKPEYPEHGVWCHLCGKRKDKP